MPFAGTGVIWMNGSLVNWADAKIHIASHVIHYGSGVFEGARCYETPKGSACFRLDAHTARLYDSAKIYRMPIPLEPAALNQAVLDTIRANHFKACYIRPLVYRGYSELGVNPFGCPVDAAILCWEWGAYLGPEALEKGVDVRVSSWTRAAPNTFPTMAKAVANYASSQLIKMEAIADGYAEGIALDVDGHVSEGSAQNLFLVRHGIVYTPPLHASVLPGITRDSIITIARDLGYDVREDDHPARDALHRRRAVLRGHGRRGHADPVGGPDRRSAPGACGPVTRALQQRFFEIINGEVPDTPQLAAAPKPASEQPRRRAGTGVTRDSWRSAGGCERITGDPSAASCPLTAWGEVEHVSGLESYARQRPAQDRRGERGVRPAPQGRQLPDDARQRRADAGLRGSAASPTRTRWRWRPPSCRPPSARSSRRRRRSTSPTASRRSGASAATCSSSAARSAWSCASSRCAIRTIEELGLPGVLAKIADEDRGLVLVTGTTGSGKSTTLAAMVDHINSTRCVHVMTIEDPIEFLHRDNRSIVNQREVAVDTHSFAYALRSALRQDPDVILVGEMRDFETIETALVAAETGHLVFSTLHTLDATETINRIIAVFPPHQQKQIRLQLAAC